MNTFGGQLIEPATPMTDETKLWSIAAHLGPLLLWIIAPLVVYLVQKDKDEFSAQNAWESLKFQLLLTIVWIINIILTFFCIGAITSVITVVIALFYMIVATIHSAEGKIYKYPISGSF